MNLYLFKLNGQQIKPAHCEKEKNLLEKELSYLSAKKRRFNRMDEEQQVACGFAINSLHLELSFPEDNEYEFSRDSNDEFECFFKIYEILYPFLMTTKGLLIQ